MYRNCFENERLTSRLTHLVLINVAGWLRECAVGARNHPLASTSRYHTSINKEQLQRNQPD